MNKKAILQMALASSLLTVNSSIYAYTSVENTSLEEKPNIVTILVDDLGYSDLGSYGSEIQTPNIDYLASEGVMFSNYHTSASCAPSRAMLLTGVDNHLAGVPNIPEALPPEQQGLEDYEGVLSDDVVTVASHLKDEGYHTYMSGKWHLGKEDNLPYNRGFDRTLSMADTGADNWEQRPYMSMYDHAHWTRDGEETQLEEPFYSSELIVDEMIGFIDSNIEDDVPFYSYISFLAVHMPVQSPEEYTDMYMDTYIEGWKQLRTDRYNSTKEIGLVPEDSEIIYHDFVDDWDSLSEEEKEYEAKRMAVYAGMVTAMDDNVGKLIDYLKEVGEYDNTIFIVTSDNGPEYSSMVGLDMKLSGYSTEYEDLGEIGSFNYIDKNFASAAASPLSYFKFYSGEGGLRVPLIISGPGITSQDDFQNSFTHVTDITPTILDIAGASPPTNEYKGREVEEITGKSLVPILHGETNKVYLDEDFIGYEVGGNVALFNGDYKIVMNREPLGDSEWYMYDIVKDPGETNDLKQENPVQFQKMLNQFAQYTEEKGVYSVPNHYSQDKEIEQQVVRNKAGDSITTMILVLITLSAFRIYALKTKR